MRESGEPFLRRAAKNEEYASCCGLSPRFHHCSESTDREHSELHLCEVVERPDHPWFVAVQFHPEFQSRPTDAHPLFDHFVRAALQHTKRKVSVACPSATKEH